jgi:hypothetical protein
MKIVDVVDFVVIVDDVVTFAVVVVNVFVVVNVVDVVVVDVVQASIVVEVVFVVPSGVVGKIGGKLGKHAKPTLKIQQNVNKILSLLKLDLSQFSNI